MFRTTAFCALTLALLVAPSRARDCANADTQPEMNRCAYEEYERADAALNGVYRALMGRLDDQRRQRLIVAERAWLKYRDAHCRSETTQSEGGSIHPLLYDSCLTEVTAARTKELQASLDCELGRGTCND